MATWAQTITITNAGAIGGLLATPVLNYPEVAILGEKLTVLRPGGTDLFTSPGRPVATISNVRLEYRAAPSPAKRPPAR